MTSGSPESDRGQAGQGWTTQLKRDKNISPKPSDYPNSVPPDAGSILWGLGVFKPIFFDHWEPFKHAYPRYQTAYCDGLVARMLSYGNPEQMGDVEHHCQQCGQGKHLVSMSYKSSLCLRCAKVYGDNRVSKASKVLHESVIYRHIILTVPGPAGYRQRYEKSTGQDPLICLRCGSEMGLWRIWHPPCGVIYERGEGDQTGHVCIERATIRALRRGGCLKVRPKGGYVLRPQETAKVTQFFDNTNDMDKPNMARENTLRNALIGGVATVLAALISYYAVIHKLSSQDIRYAGRVVDEQTNGAIQDAFVSVETQGPPQHYYTDTNGIFHTTLSPDIKTVRIKVSATGYKTVDRNVSPDSRTGIEDIRLERLQGEASIVLPDELELKEAIEFIADHSKAGVQYMGHCNPQFMQTKVRGGVFQDVDWGKIIEQLQFRLKNSKTKSGYQVNRIKKKGIYQIECAN